MIKLEELVKLYGSKEAVKGISLEISPGEIFVLLGPNGAGKTTTIRILAGLLHPSAGRALVGGHNVVTAGVEARKLLAYIPDEPYLYDRLTAREFLQFIGELYAMGKDEIDTRIDELSQRFGFRDYMDELCSGYSHGMRQRIVFAAALLHSPRALIIDEPMVGLDPRSARVVKDTLHELAADGRAILMSTHTLPVAEELAHRIGIINEGKLIAIGTLDEIRQQAGHSGRLEEVFLRLTENPQSES